MVAISHYVTLFSHDDCFITACLSGSIFVIHLVTQLSKMEAKSKLEKVINSNAEVRGGNFSSVTFKNIDFSEPNERRYIDEDFKRPEWQSLTFINCQGVEFFLDAIQGRFLDAVLIHCNCRIRGKVM